MHKSLLSSFKTVMAITRHINILPKTPTYTFYSSSSSQNEQDQSPKRELYPKSPIGSPTRVQKLIASQSDPLLAKEIFDLASLQPNFQHSYSSYHSLILKLGRSRQYSLMQNLTIRLKTDRRHYPVTPGLFTDIIQIYGDAKLPDKALKTYYTMLEFDCKPLPRHLNRLLEVLLAHRNYLRPAFDVFRTAHKYQIMPNTRSYNLMMRAFCFNGDLSIAYTLFNQMFKRDVMPDVESYRILMQGLCRKSQVNTAIDLLEDMLNKGFVPDTLSYTTLLNSLCRKKKLKEAYKLLCKMKVKGCNPDIIHYNTVISGFCREGRAYDARKVITDMPSTGCLPNLVSYQTLISGLCSQGMYDDAKIYIEEMICKKFSPHISVFHALINGFCNVGKIKEACEVFEEMLRFGEAPHIDTWVLIIPRICEDFEMVKVGVVLEDVLKIEIKADTRLVDAGLGLEEYMMRKMRGGAKSRWSTRY